MALSYPLYFPRSYLGPVVAAESVAERQFRQVVTPATEGEDVRRAAVDYVTDLVLAFAGQACAAASAGEIQVSSVSEFVEDFARRASVHAYYHLELKRIWYQWESFREQLMPQIHQSRGWLDHLAALAAAGRSLSTTPTSRPAPLPVSESDEPAERVLALPAAATMSEAAVPTTSSPERESPMAMTAAACSAKVQAASKGLQKKRRQVVHAYRTAKGYDDLKVLVKRLTRGLSTDAVHAIIRGDYKSRCSEEMRLSFLMDLGLVADQWDDIAALDQRLAQLKTES